MHDYSIGNHPKEKVLFFLAFIAILITPILNSSVKNIVEYLGNINPWLSVPITAIPVFALFGGVFWLFNKYLWRVKFLRKLLLIPDLMGKWEIEGETALKKGEKVNYSWEGEITISQSWTKILIHIQTSQSSSKSVSASIHYDDGIGYRLLYQYENIPNADEPELSKHSGSAEILFDLECVTAQGHYFTDQHRNTVGIMKLRKVKDDK